MMTFPWAFLPLCLLRGQATYSPSLQPTMDPNVLFWRLTLATLMEARISEESVGKLHPRMIGNGVLTMALVIIMVIRMSYSWHRLTYLMVLWAR